MKPVNRTEISRLKTNKPNFISDDYLHHPIAYMKMKCEHNKLQVDQIHTLEIPMLFYILLYL